MKYAYYPGCTAKSTAIEYHESVKETARYLGIDLEEIQDWNCCGASSGHMINEELALSLSGRNLVLVEKMSLDMVTACPSCLHRHKVAQNEFKKDPHLKTIIEKNIGHSLGLSQQAKHILEVIYCDVGIESIQKKVKISLKGLKAVIYYGCYLSRPPGMMVIDDPENPTVMDKIMRALDVEVLDWSCKLDCCGAGLSITSPEIIHPLVSKIIRSAMEEGAEAIITACHLCQSNLDILQSMDRSSGQIPVFFFSELTAFSLGSSKMRKWLGKHMVDPSRLLENLKLI